MVRDEDLAKIRVDWKAECPCGPIRESTWVTRVRACTGVFAGVEGHVTELRKQCRVIVTLAAVRQCFSLEVGADDLFVLKTPITEARLNTAHAYGY